jgi:hypothetical protein
MQLPEEITKSAVFVCWKDGAKFHLIGTAFFVGLLHDINDLGEYVATAAHVIDSIKNKYHQKDVYLRVNSLNGSPVHIRIPIKDWHYHPLNPQLDVSVAEWSLPGRHRAPPNLDFRVIVSEALSRKVEVTKGIREGTEVFITGLFSSHSGKKQIVPILRVGNIALMSNPEEPVETKRGPMEAYLVECRSIAGLSGSPAFASIDRIVPPIIPMPPGYIAADQYRAEIRAEYYWLGLVSGHWKGKKSDLDTVVGTTQGNEPLNFGIAVVIPARTIMEVINQPKSIERRKQALVETAS